ncbi:MAG: SDR family oxidoreductase [Gammaproteobacteria bacterium]|nr:SDR family oxidoreductase [Gammaproteobacteria bacterium]
MRLKDKVAVVTGAAQGIGLGVAQSFASEGAKVLLADINEDKGREQTAAIAGAEFVRCDVGDATQAKELISAAVDRHGRIDVCVNNAGILLKGDVLELSEEDFDAVLRVNLKGAFLVGQAAAQQMVKQGSGSIINMSSVNAVMTIPNALAYNVSKGGMNQLTRNMAVSLADKGVRVNAIGPGSILTDLLKQIMTDDGARQMILSRTPMGRCGEVSEVANVAVFLASDDSSYITGECIYIDGGRLGLNYTVPVKG